MRTFAALISVGLAQFDNLSDIDLDAIVSAATDYAPADFDLGEELTGEIARRPAGRPGAAFDGVEDERYFFTATTTTTTTTTPTTGTTTTVTGSHCWKCDAMTYERCAAEGEYQLCELGDHECCFIEVREVKSRLRQLCTGCKERNACRNNMYENFLGPEKDHQCRPDYRLQGVGHRHPTQSVCRQCFHTCDLSFNTAFCFGSMIENQPTSANVGSFIHVNLKTQLVAAYAGEDLDVLGIPTWGVLDANIDTQGHADIQNFEDFTINVYHLGSPSGKLDLPNSGNNAKDFDTEMTYWSVHGARKGWWESDLKLLQEKLLIKTMAGTAITKDDFKGDWQ